MKRLWTTKRLRWVQPQRHVSGRTRIYLQSVRQLSETCVRYKLCKSFKAPESTAKIRLTLIWEIKRASPQVTGRRSHPRLWSTLKTIKPTKLTKSQSRNYQVRLEERLILQLWNSRKTFTSKMKSLMSSKKSHMPLRIHLKGWEVIVCFWRKIRSRATKTRYICLI